MKRIAVISQNERDFLNWTREQNLISSEYSGVDRVSSNGKMYMRIIDSSDLCSLQFNEIIETDNAKLGRFYNTILRDIQPCMLSTPKLRKYKIESFTGEYIISGTISSDNNGFYYITDTEGKDYFFPISNTIIIEF